MPRVIKVSKAMKLFFLVLWGLYFLSFKTNLEPETSLGILYCSLPILYAVFYLRWKFQAKVSYLLSGLLQGNRGIYK